MHFFTTLRCIHLAYWTFAGHYQAHLVINLIFAHLKREALGRLNSNQNRKMCSINSTKPILIIMHQELSEYL